MLLPGSFEGFETHIVSSYEDFERSDFAARAKGFAFLESDSRRIVTLHRNLGPVRITYTETSGHRIVQWGEGRLGASAVLSGRLYAQGHGALQLVGSDRGIVHRSGDGRSQVGLPGTSVLVVSWPEPKSPSMDEGRAAGAMALGRGNRIYREVLSFWQTIMAAQHENRCERAAILWAARMSDHAQTLLRAETGADVATITGALRHVRRAEEMMRDGLSTPLTIAEIASAIGLTPRALQGAFVRHRARTPHEQLSLMRLSAAYERLRRPTPEDTVLKVALDCGISHPGRFASAYARIFGEHPSQTLRRCRPAA